MLAAEREEPEGRAIGEEVAAAVSSGDAEALVRLLQGTKLQQHPNLVNTTLTGLGNLASGKDTKVRDRLLDAGVIDALNELYVFMQQASWDQAQRVQVLRALTRLAAKLCDGLPPPAADVDCFANFFSEVLSGCTDPAMLSDAASGLMRLKRIAEV